jgi:hypothetical protein
LITRISPRVMDRNCHERASGASEVKDAPRMAQTIEELIETIRQELNDLYAFKDERKGLIEQIDDALDIIDAAAENDSDWNLMNDASRIKYRIAHVLDAANDDFDELTQALKTTYAKAQTDGLGTEDSREALENILAKARFSNALAVTLRNTLKEILDESRALLKPESKPE